MAASASSRRLHALQSHLATSVVMSYKSPITSHVLDTSRGRPAANMRITLQALDASSGQWHQLNHGVTNEDGRVATPLVPEGMAFQPGTYQLVFDTKSYFEQIGVTEYFYPMATITFEIKQVDQHYHVPLLINPFGFSTYRGS
ncbi:hypothetical protein Poli38472_011455 [Pythium oligandrum]|uniref:5-hydroxyisourate hydrolase n=1 Tax=Pythium oligandrum TaxID=41045 RepID=A0A8K1FI39_PYTOL|nr:hypothetical protein Poli38472_011455 [Pythium oligandrum]|eukprot:TMW64575.1 hypothetical protein Poli38472_011455 [Pythium oligandrum]